MGTVGQFLQEPLSLIIDIGTHASKEEPRFSTLFDNVMKNTTNSAICKSFVNLAKTVTSALKGNKTPPKQVAPPECAIPVRSVSWFAINVHSAHQGPTQSLCIVSR